MVGLIGYARRYNMKPSVIVYMLLLVCLSCRQPAVLGTSPFTSQLEMNGLPEQVEAVNSILDEDKFYVSVEIVVHAEQIAQYPLMYEALNAALQEWTNQLPVCFTIYIEEQQLPFRLPFEPPSFVERWNVVEVLLDDLQSPPFSYSMGILGIWDPYGRQLLFDAEFLETQPDVAYPVALHELGHMFGLPHVVGIYEPAFSGWLVLPESEDAETYVMYPSYVSDKGQKALSEIEIEIARHHLLHWWTNPSDMYRNERCHLTTKTNSRRTRCGGYDG